MPGKLIDLTGKHFGRYTVVRRETRAATKHPHWLCRCSCGNTRIVNGAALRKGYSQSCGCLRRELNSERQRRVMAGVQKRNRAMIAVFGKIELPGGQEGPVSPHANKPKPKWRKAKEASATLAGCLGMPALPAGFGRVVKLMNLDAAV
jgi:hypothetical protein